MTIYQARATRIIQAFRCADYTFADIYQSMVDSFAETYGDKVIEYGLKYGTSPVKHFIDYCPNLCSALRLIYGDSTLTEFDDMILLDSFMSFRLSMKFIVNIATALVQVYPTDEFLPLDPIAMLDENVYPVILRNVFMDVEHHFGEQLARAGTMLFASYTDAEALNNVMMTDKYTPRVKTTTTTKDNFKTTTDSKNNTKIENSENTYGFNSNSPVPTGGNVTEGTETYNNSNVVSSGVEADNHSTVTTEQDNDDTRTRDGFEGKHGSTLQDTLMKELEIRKIDFYQSFKNAFRKELFVL